MMRRKSGSGGVGQAMRLLLRGLLLSQLLPRAAAQVEVLTTTYQGGRIQDGVMFDVRTVTVNATSGSDNTVAPDGITIFGLNILTPSTEEFCVELYTKSGTFLTDQNNMGAWDFLGSFALVGQGPTTPTTIPLGAFDPVVMGVDETQAFYVTTQDENLRYTYPDDGSAQTGAVFAEDVHHLTKIERGPRKRDGRGSGINANKREIGDRRLEGEGMAVQILAGVAKNYPFQESWDDRVFNGALLYTVGQDPSLSFLTAQQQEEAWAAKRGQVTCDAAAIPIESYPSAAPSELRLPTISPVGTPTQAPTKSPTGSPTPGPTTLESTVLKVATTLHGGLKQSGCMFDIKVPSVEDGGPPEGVTILTIEMSTFLTDEICVEVYSKAGTYEGFETDVTELADGTWASPTWNILGAATVVGNGETEPTQLPIGSLDKVYVAPGETRGFYVTMTMPEMRYTEPKYGEESGDLFSGSPLGYLELMVGSAVAYPFEEVWPDRIYNGAVVFALGNVEDGKYSDLTAEDRNRTCPMPSEAPTASPTSKPTLSLVAGDIVDPVDTTAPTASPVSNVTDSSSTPSKTPTTAPTGTVLSLIDPAGGARLAAACPNANAAETKNVEVSYEYTIVTAADADPSLFAEEMEDVLHRSLEEDKCGSVRRLNELTRKLEDVAYQGFNSDPADELSTESCSADVVLGEGQVCHLITGGVTAVVPSDADEEVVRSDIGSFAEDVFTSPDNYGELGIDSVGIVTDDTSGDDQGTDVSGAKGIQEEAEGGSTDSGSTGLSTTGIAIIAAVAGALLIVLVVLAAMHMRKKKRRTKRADEGELFREFPEEEERAYGSSYGVTASSSAGYTESFAPLSKFSAPPPPSTPPPRTSSRGSRRAGGEPAVILNEADDISLFSSDKSKARFGPTSMLAPDSPGSRGSGRSGGSGGSKKSVEFIKAGNSFSSRGNQPEDTVDL